MIKHRLRKRRMPRAELRSMKQNIAFSEAMIRHAAEGFIVLDASGSIRYINPTAARLFKYSAEALLKSGIQKILPFPFGEDDGSDDGASPVFTELEGRDSEGGAVPIMLSKTVFSVENQRFTALSLQDIADRRRFEQLLQRQASYDELTGLPNRLFLKERMFFESARARRSGSRFAIMHLDLDRFKLINDTLGHEAGNQVLKEIATRLKQAVRADDLVARLAGDEFVILLPGLVNVDLVGKIATKILDTVKRPLMIEGNRLSLSISIGITIFPDDAQDVELLLTYADIAMHRAKENGKDTFQAFTPELNARAVERLDLENGLYQALENGEFIVYYQPKVNAKTFRIVGMEALVRWQHPKLGLISPVSFIPVAEETGLIVPLGTWVLETACRQNQSLVLEGLPPLTVAVNLSMRQFEAQNLAKTVGDILKSTGMAPELLELEITESIAMKNPGFTAEVVKALQQSGITFAIDDFGTGYSSLSHINSLAVDKLKIDRSFVSPIDGVHEHAIIASTVLTLGKSLKMQVIAEGVETQTQADFFKDNDCDELQGYFIARPMTWEAFAALYRESMLQKDR